MNKKWKLLGIAIVLHMLTYFGSRWISVYMYHYDLTTSLDRKIPVVPWTIVIYLGCYGFWLANYTLGFIQEEGKACRFLMSEIIAKLVCLHFYLLFPTTCVRPLILGNGFFEHAMRWLYQMDAADNLLPSIHCLSSWLCVVAVRDQERVPSWYKVLSVVLAILVCISTLTTKQHVIVDVIAGVALAEFSYWLAGRLILDKKGSHSSDSML